MAFINLKSLPKELLSSSLEFTPVDYLANFIVNLLSAQSTNINIYHLYNNNYINLLTFMSEIKINNSSINFSIIPFNEFKDIVLDCTENYFGLANYLNTDRKSVV